MDYESHQQAVRFELRYGDYAPSLSSWLRYRITIKTMKTVPPVHRIALLFNGSKIYDRGIISGIG
ncbi:hypothetical protein, partial [Pseudomonas viridiflava]|uniref:hypothetical protein n=1 Tax=Pseudomonas viridiflava TaxID=33069 RepID=UPI0019822EB3